jgi:hypothetical protein
MIYRAYVRRRRALVYTDRSNMVSDLVRIVLISTIRQLECTFLV